MRWVLLAADVVGCRDEGLILEDVDSKLNNITILF